MNRGDRKKLDDVAKDYIIIYVHDNDGTIFIENNKTADEVRKIIHERKMNMYDYAILKGELIKDFT